MSSLIIIPYRDRKNQLQEFLNEVVPLFEKHLSRFKVVIVEQGDDKPFNRGALMNIAFKEYGNKFEYIITNDVDTFPTEETVKNTYTQKGDVVRIFCAHRWSCGGICKIKSNVFSMVNGFPSDIWGWGVEDRSLFFRFNTFGINCGPLLRPSLKILDNAIENNEEDTSKFLINHNRRQYENYLYSKVNIKKRKQIYQKSGINTLHYKIIEKKNIKKNVELIKIIF